MQALSLSISALVKQYFESIFAAILPLYLGADEGFQSRATKALQVSIFELAGISEAERDALIQKRMVCMIKSFYLRLRTVYKELGIVQSVS